MNEDLKRAYANAYRCQDACNLSGLVFSFAKDMQAICDEANRLSEGTNFKNQHPIVIAYLDKLCSLAGIQSFEPRAAAKITGALEECRKLGEVTDG
jgi:hypothetical protein